MKHYFILLKEKVAVRRERGLIPRGHTHSVSGLPSGQFSDQIQVLEGSLWYLSVQEQQSRTGTLNLQSVEYDNVVIDCEGTDVEKLTEQEFDLLAALPACNDRLKVFNDKQWLNDGIEIKQDSIVWLINLQNFPNKKVPGRVRYKGKLPNYVGTWFGVEHSVENHGKGTTDGNFRRQRYFVSPMDSAVFVPIMRVRRCPSPELFREAQLGYLSPSGEIAATYAQEPPDLKLGDRVVWLSDTCPEFGTVKWIGILPECDANEREWTVGVEFDKAVGTGTGKYRDKQLFRARQNHASLVPVLGLLKESDFMGGPAVDTNHRQATSPQQDYGHPHVTSPQDAATLLAPGRGGYQSPTATSPAGTYSPDGFERSYQTSLSSLAGEARGYDLNVDYTDNEAEGLGKMSLTGTNKSVSSKTPLKYNSNRYADTLTSRQKLHTDTISSTRSIPPDVPDKQEMPKEERSIYDRHYYENISNGGSSRPSSVENVYDNCEFVGGGVLRTASPDRLDDREGDVRNGASSDNRVASPRDSRPVALEASAWQTEPRYANCDASEDRGGPSRTETLWRTDRTRQTSEYHPKPYSQTEPLMRGPRFEGLPECFGGRPKSVDNVFQPQECRSLQQLPYHIGKSKFYEHIGQEQDQQLDKDYAGLFKRQTSNSLEQIQVPRNGVLSQPAADQRPDSRVNPPSAVRRIVEQTDSGESPLRDTAAQEPSAGSRGGSQSDLVRPPQSGSSSSSSSPSLWRKMDHRAGKAQRTSGAIAEAARPAVGSKPITLTPAEANSDIEMETVVEVTGNPVNCRYGVVKWIGYLGDRSKPILGLEMEEESASCTDGMFGGFRVFSCQPRRAFFVHLQKVKRDGRFEENARFKDIVNSSMAFGSLDCPDVIEDAPPPSDVTDLSPYLGRQKGIQGHHNSCYLDATLFGMFAFSLAFDILLHRPRREEDIKEYEEVQQVLRQGIVNPLRSNFFVRADKVLKLRNLLDKLSSVAGLMTDEKDPEEFLNSLLQEILKADPFLRLSTPQGRQDAYCYQLFMEKDEHIVLPSTQQLLGLSFLQAEYKLSEKPSCLILQMPRFGKDFRMYRRILPSLTLDITDVLECGPRECAICGALAEFECCECYKQFGDGTSLDKIAFCSKCLRTSHSHAKRASHKPRKLKLDHNYLRHLRENDDGDREQPLPLISRVQMELFAVICIETSHYVSFVKCGSGPHSQWVFFDSMADRVGEANGYNIPVVEACDSLPDWLLEENQAKILSCKEDRDLPEHMRRLLCDAYVCMYQSTETLMYK